MLIYYIEETHHADSPGTEERIRFPGLSFFFLICHASADTKGSWAPACSGHRFDQYRGYMIWAVTAQLMIARIM